MKNTAFALTLASLMFAPSASALDVIWVTDATNDTIWRCQDLNNDGDYNDANEVASFYNDVAGPLQLTNNIGIRSTASGAVYVSDSSEDCLFRFKDQNNDGDALDPGENVVFFDGRAGGNLSGVLMPSGNSPLLDVANNTWYIASSNTGAGGNDALIRVVDSNNDGDANDLGEASEFWTGAGAPTGDNVPQAVAFGPDGKLYLLNVATAGSVQRGVYRLDDQNNDGDANDAGEVTTFFTPPGGSSLFMWCLELGNDGWFYTADTGAEIVWKFRDLNADGDAQDVGESFALWTVGAASILWDTSSAADGSFYWSDGQNPQRLFRVLDANANNLIEPGESLEIYNETLAGAVIGNGRGVDIDRTLPTATLFCFGDGAGTPCPCANNSAVGDNDGCLSSLSIGGRLRASGSASVANDTLVLAGTQMPNSSCLYFQGTAQAGAGVGTLFGDGLRCAGGSIIRLGTKTNVGGVSQYPAAGDLAISVKGLVPAAGGTRTYQAWYRNGAAFCTVSTFNLSNGVQVAWLP